MIGTVTADDVRKAIVEMKIKEWTFSRCSICQAPIRFLFYSADMVAYVRACRCDKNSGLPVGRQYEDVAYVFNRESSDESRQRLWNDFICSGKETL